MCARKVEATPTLDGCDALLFLYQLNCPSTMEEIVALERADYVFRLIKSPFNK